MANFTFEYLPDVKPLEGRSYYASDHYSFDFDFSDKGDHMNRRGQFGVSVLVFDTLQIHVSIESHCALYCSGYCPHGIWENMALVVPVSQKGGLKVSSDTPLLPGIGYNINLSSDKFYYDSVSGWFCAGEVMPPSDGMAVEFADGCLIVITSTGIHSVWIHNSDKQSLNRLPH